MGCYDAVMVVPRKTPCKQLSDPEAAYLAGLMDGEAHISVTQARTSRPARNTSKGISYRLMVCIRMTDRRPLDYAQGITGVGNVKEKRRSGRAIRVPYSWDLWSVQAASVLAQVRPFLIVKAEVADVCMEFQAEVSKFDGRRLSEADWQFREDRYLRCKELNYGSSTQGEAA